MKCSCGHQGVADLVTSARNGDERAWGALVERYAPLIWSICRGRHLGLVAGEADASRVMALTFVGLPAGAMAEARSFSNLPHRTVA